MCRGAEAPSRGSLSGWFRVAAAAAEMPGGRAVGVQHADRYGPAAKASRLILTEQSRYPVTGPIGSSVTNSCSHDQTLQACTQVNEPACSEACYTERTSEL